MICSVLVDEKKGTPVTRLAAVSNMLLNKNKEKCLDYKYNKMIEELRNLTWAEQASAGGKLNKMILLNNFLGELD